MTKEDLSQVRNLQNEIKLLKEQKAEIQQKMSTMSTPHSVQASSKHLPYQLHNITVQGVAKSETDAFLDADELRQKIVRNLTEREQRCIAEYDKINEFIHGIKDSEIRQILTLYYLKGMTWPQVAFRIGCQDEGTPRKKVDKFLERSGNSGL